MMISTNKVVYEFNCNTALEFNCRNALKSQIYIYKGVNFSAPT